METCLKTRKGVCFYNKASFCRPRSDRFLLACKNMQPQKASAPEAWQATSFPDEISIFLDPAGGAPRCHQECKWSPAQFAFKFRLWVRPKIMEISFREFTKRRWPLLMIKDQPPFWCALMIEWNLLFCILLWFFFLKKLRFQLGSAASADRLAAVHAGERVWKMRGGTGGDTGGPTSVSFNHQKPNAPSIRTQWGLKEERSCLALSDREFLCLTRGPKGMWPLPSFLSSLL